MISFINLVPYNLSTNRQTRHSYYKFSSLERLLIITQAEEIPPADTIKQSLTMIAVLVSNETEDFFSCKTKMHDRLR